MARPCAKLIKDNEQKKQADGAACPGNGPQSETQVRPLLPIPLHQKRQAKGGEQTERHQEPVVNADLKAVEEKIFALNAQAEQTKMKALEIMIGIRPACYVEQGQCNAGYRADIEQSDQGTEVSLSAIISPLYIQRRHICSFYHIRVNQLTTHLVALGHPLPFLARQEGNGFIFVIKANIAFFRAANFADFMAGPYPAFIMPEANLLRRDLLPIRIGREQFVVTSYCCRQSACILGAIQFPRTVFCISERDFFLFRLRDRTRRQHDQGRSYYLQCFQTILRI